MTEKKKRNVLLIGIAVIGLLCVTYLALYYQAKNKFASGTVINEIDVSGMGIDELKERVREYSLDVVERTSDGKTFTETIKGKAFGVSVGSNEKAAHDLLEQQTVWQYITRGGKEHTIPDWLEYDEEKLKEITKELKCFDSSFTVKPKNAKISDYTANGYTIIAENNGNTAIEEKVIQAVLNAVHEMATEVNLEKKDCYEKPALTSESEEIKSLLDKLNKYTGVTVTYRFDDNTEILDGVTISKWLSVNKKNKIVFDEEKVAEFVATLRRKYDTIFSDRKFKTSYGNTVTVSGGDYGWWMNYKKEEKELVKLIKKGKSVERTPEYYQKAKSYGKRDYGNTYIEINLTKQRVFLYVKGKKILETDCVTGNAARGYDTPAGTYSITYTQRDATLVGENYSTPVKYWMPFNRNIGLHDANWRNRFGGIIYKTNGSHGCVNLPPKAAEKIFKYAKAGMPVICYHSSVEPKTDKKTDKKVTAKKKTTKTTSKKKTAKKTSTKKKNSKKSNKKSSNKKNNN